MSRKDAVAARWVAWALVALAPFVLPHDVLAGEDEQALDAALTRFKKLVSVDKVADFELRWRDYLEKLHKSAHTPQAFVRPVLAAGDGVDWPLDKLTMQGGTVYCGLYRGERDDGRIDFLEVIRRPGDPLFFQARWPLASEVAAREDLSPAKRKQLREMIDKYRNRREYETLDKKKLRFGQRRDDFNRNLATYRSKTFELESTADDDTTRTAVVRIDERVQAYRKLLPPRIEPQRPLRILLLGSTAEYNLYLDRAGLKVANPAFYNAQDNLVVAVTENGTLKRKWEEALQHNKAVEQELQREKEELAKILAADSKLFIAGGANSKEVRDVNLQRRIRQTERKEEIERQLKECDRRNLRKYDELTDQMFRIVYHEAFHAYLANYVYDPATHDTPRWLNEGLAQIFEDGRLESGNLRIDAPDRAKLERLWNDLQRPDALSLIEVFRAQPEAFLGIHRRAAARGADGPANAAGEAERYYLYSWGLAHYLTFEQRVLGTPALDAFLERHDTRESREPAAPAIRR